MYNFQRDEFSLAPPCSASALQMGFETFWEFEILSLHNDNTNFRLRNSVQLDRPYRRLHQKYEPPTHGYKVDFYILTKLGIRFSENRKGFLGMMFFYYVLISMFILPVCIVWVTLTGGTSGSVPWEML